MFEINNNAAGDVALEVESDCRGVGAADDRLYYTCIMDKQKFAIDPYGGMTFCGFVKDPSLRFDLKKGTFQQAWDDFLPGLVDKVHGGEEWRNNCGDCENRSVCRSCAAFSYLETGNHFSRVPYLCAVAQESENFKQDWQEKHRRYFMIGGITVRVESDLDLSEAKFKPEFSPFAVGGPGNDNVTLNHIFGIPDISDKDLGPELYHKAPWSISRKGGTWFYRGISADPTDPELTRLAVFSADYQHGLIYSPYHFEKMVQKEGWHSLSLLPTDQIWLVELLADRNAVLLHSSAVILNRQGLLFVGHSDAGKSTTTMLLKRASQVNPGSLEVEILCDDRNIVRRWPDGWRVHGTWSHGDVPEVSGAEAPVKAILFLRQDNHNELVRLTDRQEIWKGLLATLIKSMVTAQWWQKEMDVLEKIVDEVPCYVMHFDKSGGIVPELEKLVNSSMSVDGK
jgi:radical SAM protein with 4Fe4S-binding SPASM domain